MYAISLFHSTHAMGQIDRSSARGEPRALTVRLIEELVEETPKLMEGKPFKMK